ncbi:MAG: hypothetical protein CMJ89_04095 [Planctomycetes bacterium]|nr:hypothetical protein [Planctomycetota bacterium]
MDPLHERDPAAAGSRLGRGLRHCAGRKRTGLRRGLGLALIFFALGPAHEGQSDLEIALGLYEELGPLALEGELDPELGLELWEATERLIRSGSTDVDPIEAFRTALLAAEAAEAPPAKLIPALVRYANLLQAWENRAGVIQVLEPRLSELWKRSNEGALFSLELMLIQVLRETLHWQEAFERLDALMPRIASAGNSDLYESFAYGERASLYLLCGLVDLATLWHERQREVLGPWLSAIRHADFIEANLLLARGEYARADQRISEMLEDERRYPRTAQERGRLLVRAGVARINLARRDPSFLAAAEEATSQALEMQLKFYEFRRAHLVLGEAAMLAGDSAQALEHIERALFEGVSSPSPIIHAISWTLRARLAREAAESGDARDSLESALTELGKAYLDFLESRGRLALRPGGFGFLKYREERQVLSELMLLAQALQPGEPGRRAAFQFLLRAQELNSIVRSIRKSTEVATIEEIRDELCPSGHGFLVYVPSTERSHLFLLDGENLDHFLLAADHVLEESQQRLIQRYLRAPPRDGEARDLFLSGRKECFEENARLLLPEKARARIRSWTHLTVIGYELTNLLPFEDLPLEDGERLGDRCAVGYLSALPTGLALARRRAEAPPRGAGDTEAEIWMLSNPRPHETFGASFGLEDLPLDATSAREMTAAYSGREIRFLHGPEARPAALQSASLARAKVLQIVAHGAADLEQERPAMLLLGGPTAEDSLLRCADVDRIRSPELVALTACSTAKGPSREGDWGAADFEGAFLAAGASCVVLSPYPVEFHSSRLLMRVFHRELARGAAPSEALQRARSELRDDPRFAEMHLTSLIRACGLAHVAIFESPPPAAFDMRWLLAVPVVGVGWLFMRRRRWPFRRSKQSDLGTQRPVPAEDSRTERSERDA